ncbi:MAG: asparagine synthase (glutamine-hydrolyzing) [Chloroflexi bacterium]|nr:asparagine synthase (glutamine-hydrolyzing) [Chloroflexota bacterium]
MCGICGVYNLRDSQPIDRKLLATMGKTLRHRGPDDEGVYADGPIGLAFRRLAILDLSPAGRQPMTNEDGTLWIAYNGEIYNYPDLRRELEPRHPFRSRADTEAILHLYEEHGDACLERLRGMFAFALWDGKRQRLLLAVDRLGIKPLYYTQGGGALGFASEAKALLPLPWVTHQIDPHALDAYLALLCVPAPLSILKDVRRLPPGHRLVAEEGAVSVAPYWDLRFTRERGVPEAEWSRCTREVLQSAVEKHLLSDVPLGVLLSGGIDSSAIVALMSQTSRERVRTFSIGFTGPGADGAYDELAYARIVAKRFDTEHHEMTVEPRAADILPRIVWHFDEPFANETAVPMYYVCQMARQHVTVALGGVGGDEAFGGYPRYIAAKALRPYFRVPPLLRGGVKLAARAIRESASDYSMGTRLHKFLRGATGSPEEAYCNWQTAVPLPLRREVYSPTVRTAIEDANGAWPVRRALEAHSVDAWLDRVLYTDIRTYLPDNLLTYSDRMSMAHSLELRVPFCDYQVMEFAARIPPAVKLPGADMKHMLKKALAGLLPDEILYRRKQGFSVPVGYWLRADLAPLARALLAPERLRRSGLFSGDAIQRLWESHARGSANYTHLLWALIIFQVWHSLYVENTTLSEPALSLRDLV